MFKVREGKEALPDNIASDTRVRKEHVPDSGAFHVRELAIFPHSSSLIILILGFAYLLTANFKIKHLYS